MPRDTRDTLGEQPPGARGDAKPIELVIGLTEPQWRAMATGIGMAANESRNRHLTGTLATLTALQNSLSRQVPFLEWFSR